MELTDILLIVLILLILAGSIIGFLLYKKGNRKNIIYDFEMFIKKSHDIKSITEYINQPEAKALIEGFVDLLKKCLSTILAFSSELEETKNDSILKEKQCKKEITKLSLQILMIKKELKELKNVNFELEKENKILKNG